AACMPKRASKYRFGATASRTARAAESRSRALCIQHSAVDGAAARDEQVARVMKVFGVPDKQQAARLEQGGELGEHAVLRLLVEIDHYVATENCIKAAAHVPLGVEQVEPPESEHGLQRRLRAYLSALRTASAHKVTLHE